jgi:hypothetical protein
MDSGILFADGSGTIAQWVGAIGTLLAVLVALFLQLFIPWWRRPTLTVHHEASGKFLPTVITDAGQRRSYARIQVVNDGALIARDCRGYLLEVERLNAGTNTYVTVFEDTIPLAWSYVAANPHWRGVDLPRPVPHYLNLGWAEEGGDQFFLDLIAFPIHCRDLMKEKGIYRVTVQIAAEGAATVPVKLTIRWSGEWNTFGVTRES